MNRPAVFFDRDNTLIVSDGYLGDPDRVVLIDGAADAVARVRALGYAAVVFSNQSGVAKGHFGEEAVYAVNHRLDDLLIEDNPSAVIDRHEFCPFHPNAAVEKYRQDSDLRKPKPGMIRQAARTLGLDIEKSWVIGDAPRDIEAGKAAGCRTIHLIVPGLPKSVATSEKMTVAPDFIAGSLEQAVDWIDRHTPKVEKPAAAVEPVPEAVESPPTAKESPPAPAQEQPAATTVISVPIPESLPVQPVDTGREAVPSESAAGAPLAASVAPTIASSDASTSGEAAVPASKSKLTWGERMRAAKAHGRIPPKGTPAEDDPITSPQSQTSAGTQAARTIESNDPSPAGRDVTSIAVNSGAANMTSDPSPSSSSESASVPTESAALRADLPVDVSIPAPVVTATDAVVPAASADTAPVSTERPTVNQSRLEELTEQILQELRLQKEEGVPDFSVSKLVGAVMMVLSLAAFLYAYLNRDDKAARDSILILAIALQTVVISLLIMGKQK